MLNIKSFNSKELKGLLGKNWKYIAAVLFFVVFVVILVSCTDSKEKDHNKKPGASETDTPENFVLDAQFEKDAYPEINELISCYYDAYTSINIELLGDLAAPITDNEKSYVAVFGDYIEEYRNIVCYTKHGPTKGSFLVSVYYDMKFHEIETMAPGLDFFYVEPGPDGKLMINNLYGSYNLSRVENELDANIYAIILKYIQQDDVSALQSEVDRKFTDAMAADADLATLLTSTIPMEMKKWLDSVTKYPTKPEPTETEETEPSESESQSESETESESESQSESETESAPAVVRVQVTMSDVNIRSEAKSNSRSLGKTKGGEIFVKKDQKDNWIKIDYNGQEAWISSEFLKEVP